MKKEFIGLYDADWEEFEGVLVLRVKGSKFVAVPSSGRKDSKLFDVVDINDRSDFYCVDMTKKEIRSWLAKMARDEGCKPSSYMEKI